MGYSLASQQVSWAEVHTFVLPKLTLVGDWPLIGTPAWCALGDRDRAKWAAILDGAQHWALRVEYFQQAQREASHDVSAAENWSAIANAVKCRADYFAARPWMRRCSR